MRHREVGRPVRESGSANADSERETVTRECGECFHGWVGVAALPPACDV